MYKIFARPFRSIFILAELKEVVGTEEIDGWDLDADEQINDNDLMEVDASLVEEDQPKVREIATIVI